MKRLFNLQIKKSVILFYSAPIITTTIYLFFHINYVKYNDTTDIYKNMYI